MNILGLTYLREREFNGSIHRAKVVEEVTKDELDENGEPTNDGWREYRVIFGDGTREEILTYNQMCSGDVGYAYLMSKTSEKVAFIAGDEFGEWAGHTLIVVKALYGLKSSGSRCHDFWAVEIHNQGWFPSKADPDVWMRDKGDHYEYIAVWVDDLLYVGHDPESFFQLHKEKGYKLKGVGAPTYHLGGYFARVEDPEPMLTWGSHTFVKKMLAKYEKMFGEPVPKREIHAPLEPGDHPELDESRMCSDDERSKYMRLIGDMQWAVSLGRIDIYAATVALSGFRAQPRIGHLERAKRVYKFLRNYKKTSIKFRTDECDHSGYKYLKPNFGHVYHPCKEEIPDDAPEPKMKAIQMTTFFDANLLFDYVTGRSCVGIIHMLNKTPIDWYCRKTNMVECGIYSTEFIAMKTAVEQIIELRLTLRYFGCAIRGSLHMFGDNKSVIDSAMFPSYRLKKRTCLLAFHCCCEAIVCDIVRAYHIDGKENPADILTKH